jgi:hypothetical protein
MTLPTSGPISLTDIQTEFGGSNPVDLSDYYKGGAYVTDLDYAPNVPRSGKISVSDFYGAAKTVYFCFTYVNNGSLILPATFRTPLIVTALGGGGGAGGNDAGTPGYPGYAGSIVTGNVAASPGDTVLVYVGGGGGGGRDGAIATPGAGGSSSNGYYGGTGGASGGSGSSGSGGGGGGATSLVVNGSVKLVAAGGGGGGGAGNGPAGRPNNNTPGTNSAINGGGGQPKSGDGGGGGGGGAGSPVAGAVISPVSGGPVYPGSYPVYCSFLNTYGVWPNPDFVSPVGSWVVVEYQAVFSYTPGITSYWYARASADNGMQVFVNGIPVVSSDTFQYPSDGAAFGQVNLNGINTITVMAINYGGPALFAAAIYDNNNNQIWNTRMIQSAGGGGAGGATAGGDSGGYSGENGTNLVPPGGAVSTGSNGGGSSTQPGSAGSVTVCYWAS